MILQRAGKLLFLSCVLAVGTFFTGCATNHYPEFATKSASFATLRPSVDVFIADDIKGDVDRFDAELNYELATFAMETLEASMEEKGYVAGESYTMSAGYSMGRTVQVQMLGEFREAPPFEGLVTVDAEAGAEVADAEAPAYMTPLVDIEGAADDPVLQAELIALHEKLLNLSETSKHRPSHFEEVKELGLDEDEALLLVLVVGRRVSMGKQLGQALLTSALTLGTVAIWEPDVLRVKCAVLAPDGEILWCSDWPMQVEPNEKQIENAIKRMMKVLPEKAPYAPEPAPPETPTEAPGGTVVGV